MKWVNKILDHYFYKAWVWDLALAPIFFFTISYSNLFNVSLSQKENQVNAISDLMNSDFTFAGFLLAALTIIVTFRANMRIKTLEKSRNALQLIISTDHYFTIVRAFKHGLLELLIIAFTLMAVKSVSESISIHSLNKIFVTFFIISVIVFFRTVGLMFKIIGMEKHKKDE